MTTVEDIPTIFSGHYSDRILTYVDIIGFSRDVFRLADRPGLALSFEAVLQKLHRCKNDIDRKRANGTIQYDSRMISFSDCVLISYEVSEKAALKAIAEAAFLGQLMLRAGYLPRGIINIGKLIHTDEIIFGQALICADYEEKHSVVLPKIKLMPHFYEILRRALTQNHHNEANYVRDRGDGPFVHVVGDQWWFVNKLRQEYASEGVESEPMQELFNEIRDMLPIRYASAETPSEKRKNRWMQAYVNDSIMEQGLPSELKVVLPD